MQQDITDIIAAKKDVFDYCRLMLGDGMIDIELDPEHYETALKRALMVFRQKSNSSVEESYFFLKLTEDQNTYQLPNEIVEVRSIFRRSIGSRTGGGGGGTVFEPFNLAYTNTYLLSSSNMGGLATYEVFAQYQELVGRMFGSYIEFSWHPQTHKLTLLQRPRNSDEEVLIYTWNYRPDLGIIQDVRTGIWVRDYTLATCKYMLGQARELFSNIAGPTGGSSLNGAAMKAEATAEMQKLEDDISKYVTSSQGLWFIIG